MALYVYGVWQTHTLYVYERKMFWNVGRNITFLEAYETFDSGFSKVYKMLTPIFRKKARGGKNK